MDFHEKPSPVLWNPTRLHHCIRDDHVGFIKVRPKVPRDVRQTPVRCLFGFVEEVLRDIEDQRRAATPLVTNVRSGEDRVERSSVQYLRNPAGHYGIWGLEQLLKEAEAVDAPTGLVSPYNQSHLEPARRQAHPNDRLNERNGSILHLTTQQAGHSYF